MEIDRDWSLIKQDGPISVLWSFKFGQSIDSDWLLIDHWLVMIDHWWYFGLSCSAVFSYTHIPVDTMYAVMQQIWVVPLPGCRPAPVLLNIHISHSHCRLLANQIKWYMMYYLLLNSKLEWETVLILIRRPSDPDQHCSLRQDVWWKVGWRLVDSLLGHQWLVVAKVMTSLCWP